MNMVELGKPPEKRIHWVVCGTESVGGKPGRKPEYWNDAIRHLKNQCVENKVPFFLKQMPMGFEGHKLVKMPELDGHIWNQFPEGWTDLGR